MLGRAVSLRGLGHFDRSSGSLNPVPDCRQQLRGHHAGDGYDVDNHPHPPKGVNFALSHPTAFSCLNSRLATGLTLAVGGGKTLQRLEIQFAMRSRRAVLRNFQRIP
jgi:hypothetical protein